MLEIDSASMLFGVVISIVRTHFHTQYAATKKSHANVAFYFAARTTQVPTQPLTLVPSAFWATAVAELELLCLVAVLVSVLMSPPALAITLAKSTVDGLCLTACCAWAAVAALEEEMVLIVMVHPSDEKKNSVVDPARPV